MVSGKNSRRSADVWKIHKGGNVQKWISENYANGIVDGKQEIMNEM